MKYLLPATVIMFLGVGCLQGANDRTDHPASDLSRPGVTIGTQDASYEIEQGEELDIELQVSSAPDTRVRYAIIDGPEHGVLSGAGSRYSYKSNADFIGVDRFRYQVSDDKTTSVPAMVTINVVPFNNPPVAAAGPDIQAWAFEEIQLDASASTDVETRNLSFYWKQIAGTVPVRLLHADTAMPSFVSPMDNGDYVFQVTVSDGVKTSVDSVTMTAMAFTGKSVVPHYNPFFDIFDAPWELITGLQIPFDRGLDFCNIVVKGDTLYAANGGYGLTIFDVSDPTHAVFLSKNYNYFGQPYGMKVEALAVDVDGHYAYLVDTFYGFIAFDVTDKKNPVVVTRRYEYLLRDIKVINGIGYFLYLDKLAIWDLSDPANNVLLASIPFSHTENSADGNIMLKISGSFAYISNTSEGIVIVDISDPKKPVRRGSFPLIQIAGGYIEVGNGKLYWVTFYGLIILDVSDPENITEISATDIDGLGDLQLVGTTLYTGVLKAIDVSDPKNPSVVAEYDMVTGVDSFGLRHSGNPVVHKGHALVPINSYVEVINVEELTLGVPRRNLPLPSLAFSSHLKDKYLYLSDLVGEIAIVDVTDPLGPVSLGATYPNVDIGAIAGMRANYGYLYISSLRGLSIFNVTVPTAPTYVRTIGAAEIPDFYWLGQIDFKGNIGYLTGGAQLQIVDFSNPTSPTPVGMYKSNHGPQGITVEGDIAYVTSSFDVEVLDIGNPVAPTRLGAYEYFSPGKPHVKTTKYYTHLYVSDGGRLAIFDVSVPSAIREVGSVIFHASGYAVVGDYVYMVDEGSIFIVDVRNPANPVIAGRMDTRGVAADVASDSKYLFINNVVKGLAVAPLFPIEVKLNQDLQRVPAGSTLNYQVSWDHAMTDDGIRVRCETTQGVCIVSNVQNEARSADIRWQLTEAVDDAEIKVYVGTNNYYMAATDQLKISPN